MTQVLLETRAAGSEPEGGVWFCAPDAFWPEPAVLALVVAVLHDVGLALVVPSTLPGATNADPAQTERLAALRAALPRQAASALRSVGLAGTERAHLRAAWGQEGIVAVLGWGAALAPTAMLAARDLDLPVILAEARLEPPERARRWWSVWPKDTGPSPAHIYALDAQSARYARQLGTPREAIEIVSPIEPPFDPPRHVAAERGVMSEAFAGRPVWLAQGATRDEWRLIAAAHRQILRQTLRAMLIALPADARDGDEMARAFEDERLIVARRWLDEDPTEEVQVYLSDDPAEPGLWFRLAPLCFFGGSLAPPQPDERVQICHPYAAAALGSAIMHGPLVDQAPPEIASCWARLDAAGAAWRLGSAAELTPALASLMAPDQAALLATNGWRVSTGGIGAARRLADCVRRVARPPSPRTPPPRTGRRWMP